MQAHFQLSGESYKTLQKVGITDKVLFKSIWYFDPNGDGEPLSQISLFHYVDKHGDFNDLSKEPHRLIARELYKNLPVKEKIALAEYIESWENDFEDDEDE
jgi:hypothetical protein